MQFNIDGVAVEVSRRKIKNINLYVKPDGRVLVSAPTRASNAVIELFVRSKLHWIQSHQQRIAAQTPAPVPQYIDGELLPLWGESYPIKIVHGTRDGVHLDGGTAVLTMRDSTTRERRLHVINEWYRALLKAEIERLLPKWEAITGLYCTNWNVKNMSTRWGTCNVGARRVWLSLQLAAKPMECLEYVILHELAHLKERTHGKRFVAVMDRYMPNWQAVRSRLNAGGVAHDDDEIVQQ